MCYKLALVLITIHEISYGGVHLPPPIYLP